MRRSPVFLALAALCLMTACGGSDKKRELNERNIDSLSRPENITIVAAIAKVEPESGFIDLAAEVSGIVAEIYKKEGDKVKEGEALFRLDEQDQALEVASARQDVVSQQSRIEAGRADVRQYEASLKEKEEDLAITKRLAATGADTRQNLATKEKETETVRANLQSARAQLNVALSDLEALKHKLSQAQRNAKNRVVRAKQDGTLVSFGVKTGSAVNALEPFGQLASTDALVLHGEIDEMFADRVSVGQSVAVNYVGSSEIIGRGEITYLSQILENKSLFYEKTGETTDRRVRRFKASIASGNPLLINAKVECKIKVE